MRVVTCPACVRRRLRRLTRAVGLLAVAAFLGFAFTPLANVLARPLAARPAAGPADAIVVLASGLNPDGTLTAESLQRTIGGILLLRQERAPLLLLSGGVHSAGGSEADVRARLGRDLGLAPREILTMAGVNSTRDEAVRAGQLLRPLGVRRILLVSNAVHLVRARRVFEHAGFEVLAAPTGDLSREAARPGGRLALARLVAREVVARLYYRLSVPG